MNIFNMSNVVQVALIASLSSILTFSIKKIDRNINKRTIFLLNLIFNALLVLCVNVSYFCYIGSWFSIDIVNVIIQVLTYVYVCTLLSQIFYDKLKDIEKEWKNEQLNSSNNNSDS